jgi:hypothetical protein
MAPLDAEPHAIGTISMDPSGEENDPVWSACLDAKDLLANVPSREWQLVEDKILGQHSYSVQEKDCQLGCKTANFSTEPEPMHLDRCTWQQRVRIGTNSAMVVGSYFRSHRSFYVMKQS